MNKLAYCIRLNCNRTEIPIATVGIATKHVWDMVYLSMSIPGVTTLHFFLCPTDIFWYSNASFDADSSITFAYYDNGVFCDWKTSLSS